MIEKKLYKKLMVKWDAIRKVYQKPRRIVDRINHFEEHCLPHLKGKDVLEIGCNAGAFSYIICKEAKSYVGVDLGYDYIRQSRVTQKYIKEFNQDVRFIRADIKKFIKKNYAKDLKFNAFVTCFTLYHFTNKELDKLERHVFPKCDVIITQNSEKEKKHRVHNKHHFHKSVNVVKYFEKLGYKCEIIWARKEGMATGKYAEVIALK